MLQKRPKMVQNKVKISPISVSCIWLGKSFEKFELPPPLESLYLPLGNLHPPGKLATPYEVIMTIASSVSHLFQSLFFHGNISFLASSNGKSGNSGGNGGTPKKPPGNGKEWWRDIYENPQQYLWLGIAASVGAGWLMLSSGSYSHEINWQEFRTNYLAKGEVSMLILSMEAS
jgi:hypothetical protein